MRLLSLRGSALFAAAVAAITCPAFAHEHEKNHVDVIRSARSGAWSAADTWEGGKQPSAGAKVLIREPHRVVYDLNSEDAIRGINIAGTLAFATDRNTRLDVGLIKIQSSEAYSEDGFDCDAHVEESSAALRPALEIGTPQQPLDSRFRATIRLKYFEGMDKQSCPAIVCCGGRLDLHGAPLNRTWVKLGADLARGDTVVTLAEAVTGWQAGDRIILTATNTHGERGKASPTEERFVTKVDKDRLTLDQPVEHSHAGTGEFRGEIADLSRNIVVESAAPDEIRGHTMYHRGSAGSLSYTEFRHLGKLGVLGRYSLHFHLVGDTMRGSSVIGNSIWDSGNRWLTIHGTNYLIVRDNVGYKSAGHGFFLEDGTEVFNTLDRNLAVGARRAKKLPKQVLPFDGNEGAGYWWANSLNTFTRNVAANCGEYGFRFEATPTSALQLTLPVQKADGTVEKIDIRTLPFVRFDDNEVHSTEGLYGINLGEGVNKVGPDVRRPFIVRNTKIWDVHYAFRPQVPSLLVENMQLHRFVYGVYHPHFENHVYRNLHLSDSNAAEPFNRGHDDLSVQSGILTVDGLTFDKVQSGSTPLIQISDDNDTGRAVSHFRNVKVLHWAGNEKSRAIVNLGAGPRPQPKTEKGVTIYIHDWFGAGRTAEVVSTRSPEFKAAPDKYRAVPDLTGDESRAADVGGVPFPELLPAADDLPPATVITAVERVGDKLRVRGATSDNGEIARVTLNGQPVRPLFGSLREWEGEVSGQAKELVAFAVDAAGNQEPRPHQVVVPR